MALGCTVSEINNLPASEFADWQRYANTEPFGFPREESRFGVMAANTLAASQNKYKNTRITMPEYWIYKPPQALSNTESINLMKSMFPTAKRRKRKRIGY